MTLQEKMRTPGGFTTGFDYLRIGLALLVAVLHCTAIGAVSDGSIWLGPWRFFPAIILPMFFALSGFLVTGSLMRVRLHQFVALRAVRLLPALAVEVTLCALIIGLLVTTEPKLAYLQSREFFTYFLNIIGDIHYLLPGVFAQNPYPDVMNGQLWTIPFELECYFSLVVLAIVGIVSRRNLFLAAVVLVCLAFTVRVLATHRIDHTNHVPGRVLVASFLAAVAIYLHRDWILFSDRLGVISIVLAAVILEYPELSYLAPFPVAYATVWLGLMRPPAIPFGDLSYGVFLFHFPVEQTVVYLLPWVRGWWLLSLVALPLTVACAWVSWTFVERPVLSRKDKVLFAADYLAASALAVGRRVRGGRVRLPDTTLN